MSTLTPVSILASVRSTKSWIAFQTFNGAWGIKGTFLITNEVGALVGLGKGDDGDKLEGEVDRDVLIGAGEVAPGEFGKVAIGWIRFAG